MSYLNWHVGMKVVCTHRFNVERYRSEGGYNARLQFPEYKRIYTIRGLYRWREKIGIVLEEIVNPRGNPSVGINGETGFNVIRFRPVSPRKTSIEVFTRILRNPHVRIREDA